MALFQNSVLNKYIKLQDKQAVEKAYKKYTKYFHNTERQQNIQARKWLRTRIICQVNEIIKTPRYHDILS